MLGMTAPLAPQPTRITWAVVFGLIAVVIAIPFGRREDWVGWLAFLNVATVAIGFASLLIWRAAIAFRGLRR
jgi:hypothetical protein